MDARLKTLIVSFIGAGMTMLVVMAILAWRKHKNK